MTGECYRKPIVPRVQAGPRLPLRAPLPSGRVKKKKPHLALVLGGEKKKPSDTSRTSPWCSCPVAQNASNHPYGGPLTATGCGNHALGPCRSCGGLR